MIAYFVRIAIKLFSSKDRGKMHFSGWNVEKMLISFAYRTHKTQISLNNHEKTRISPKDLWKNSNCVKGSQKKCEFLQSIAKEIRISSKDRRWNANFVKESRNTRKFCHGVAINTNFVKGSLKKREFLSKVCNKNANFIKILRQNKNFN